MGFAPLLAASFEKSTDKKKAPSVESQLMKLNYPLAMQPKYDGVRVVCHPVYGVAKRKLEAVDNLDIRQKLTKFAPFYLDGEVVIVDESGETMPFRDAQSAVARHEGVYNFRLMAFDCFRNHDAGFWQRYCNLEWCSGWRLYDCFGRNHYYRWCLHHRSSRFYCDGC